LCLAEPQPDFLLAPIGQSLHRLSAYRIPAAHLIRHCLHISAVDLLQQRASEKRSDPDVETERYQRIELILTQRYADILVDRILETHEVLRQQLADLHV